MNRKQRRALGQRLEKSDPGLEIVHWNAAGIDVGNASHFVAVPGDRNAQPAWGFGCWTADLERMAQFLLECRIDTVLFQATGVYWIALKDILEQRGIEVVVANAFHTKKSSRAQNRRSEVPVADEAAYLRTGSQLLSARRGHAGGTGSVAVAGSA